MNEVLKQRVIGALVLVGVAIIFLPGFFKERQPYQVDMQTQIPASPDIAPVVFNEPSKPAGIEPAPEPATMFLPESDQPVSDNLETLQAETASVSSAPAKLVPEASAQAVSSVASNEILTGSAKAWVIQVASLRNTESAKTLRDDLQKRGYRAYIRNVATNAGSVSRVFIGPKLDKEAALTIKAKVDLIFKVNSLVLIFKP